jgi:uncharacterized membrane protein (DUF2068 family)
MSERGRAWIVAIAVFRVVKAILLIALSIGAFVLSDTNLEELAERTIEWLAVDRDHVVVERLLERIPFLTPSLLVAGGIGGLALSGLYLVEAYGLFRRRLWAEWLTIVATSVFIPFEIYEIVEHGTALGIGALVVNALIVAYLVARRLVARRGEGASRGAERVRTAHAGK